MSISSVFMNARDHKLAQTITGKKPEHEARKSDASTPSAGEKGALGASCSDNGLNKGTEKH